MVISKDISATQSIDAFDIMPTLLFLHILLIISNSLTYCFFTKYNSKLEWIIINKSGNDIESETGSDTEGCKLLLEIFTFHLFGSQ